MRNHTVPLLLLLSVPALGLASTIDVKSRGARGDGKSDDTEAINRAIEKSKPGDTIFFPSGTYKVGITTGITLEPERIYRGEAHGATIIQGSGGYSLFSSKFNEAFDIAVSNITFDGGGVRFDGKGVPARRVNVTDCTFRNLLDAGANWTSHNAIFIAAGAEQSHFDRNTFHNIFTGGKYGLDDTDATGILAYGLSRSTIVDNTFDYLNEGVHIFFDFTDGTDVLVARNHFTRIHRITMEFQHDQTDGLVIRDNTVSDALNPYWLTYGMSVAASSSTGRGIIVENNTMVANTPLDLSVNPHNYYPYGLEVSGLNTVVSNNRIIGLWGTGIGVGHARDLRLENNLVCGLVVSYKKSIDQYLGPQPGTLLDGNVVSADCPPAAQALFTARLK